ncbi:MAG: DUF3416 domain-containing protein, partial [Aquincola sp.]|nr:DUF3416 domain-containing protein [Aquincola sp.]
MSTTGRSRGGAHAAARTPASRAGEASPVGVDDGRVRVVIERVTPAVDDGRFPIKRVLGERVEVEADCFADGHDVVACALLWRRAQAPEWHHTPMLPRGNDRWHASFEVDALGTWEYTVRAWVDPFLSWRHDFARRVDPDDVRIAARTGAALLRESARRADYRADGDLLASWAEELANAASDAVDISELQRIGMDEARAAIARRHPDLRHAHVHSRILNVQVERVKARCSAWYEFFPRSASDDTARHGTFADCQAWLPY